jgi:aspartate/glutamate racemase
VHTVPALAARFDADLRAAATEPPVLTHVVEAELLDAAIRSGVDDAVVGELRSHLQHLAARGADPILVTCSSIGEAADTAAADVDATVIRIDRAMAVEVAATIRRLAGPATPAVAVLATVDATLGPTSRLIAGELRGRGLDAPVTAEVVAGAVEARLRGDQAGHDRRIAAAIEGAEASGAAVIVLAQASMATGLEVAGSVGVPVFTSPPSAVRATLLAAGLDADGLATASDIEAAGPGGDT